MNKKARNLKLLPSDSHSKTSFEEYDASFDEFEEWEGDYEFIEKKDYQ